MFKVKSDLIRLNKIKNKYSLLKSKDKTMKKEKSSKLVFCKKAEKETVDFFKLKKNRNKIDSSKFLRHIVFICEIA